MLERQLLLLLFLAHQLAQSRRREN